MCVFQRDFLAWMAVMYWNNDWVILQNCPGLMPCANWSNSAGWAHSAGLPKLTSWPIANTWGPLFLLSTSPPQLALQAHKEEEILDPCLKEKHCGRSQLHGLDDEKKVTVQNSFQNFCLHSKLKSVLCVILLWFIFQIGEGSWFSQAQDQALSNIVRRECFLFFRN